MIHLDVLYWGPSCLTLWRMLWRSASSAAAHIPIARLHNDHEIANFIS